MAARSALAEIIKRRGRFPGLLSQYALAEAIPGLSIRKGSGIAGNADSLAVVRTPGHSNEHHRLSWLVAGGLVALPTYICLKDSTVVSEPLVHQAGGDEGGLPSGSAFKPKVIFVLGGPGSGKGTQCEKIVNEFGFTHLSAGDLLRAEIKSGSADGNMIQTMIKEGRIVPAEVTVHLLEKAMKQSGNDKFLIDGFPRNDDNRKVFEEQTGIDPEFILFFDCPQEVMEKRLLGRNQGRIDDNIDTIRKRFKVFEEQSLPVVRCYDFRGKVRKVDATRSPDDVFGAVVPLFLKFREADLLESSKQLLKAIDDGDFKTYAHLCDSGLSAFEPEAQGALVKGLDFHKFYFESAGNNGSVQSTIVSPNVSIIGDVGVVTYTRLVQSFDSSTRKAGSATAFSETRIWERRKNSKNVWEWKHVHFHRSKVAA